MREESIEVKSDVPLSTDADNEFLLEHLDKVLLDLNFYDQNNKIYYNTFNFTYVICFSGDI